MSNPVFGQAVQSAFFSGTAAAAQVAFPSPVQCGSLFVAAVTWSAATGTATVSDLLNTQTPFSAMNTLMGGVTSGAPFWASTPVFAADSTSSQFFYLPVNQRAGIDVLTVTFSASQTYTITIAEYFGGGSFLASASAHGTSGGAAPESVQLSFANAIPPVSTPLFEWDRASDFQGALAQSQIQQPGVLVVGSFKTTVALGTALSGVTNRQTSGAVYAYGDSGSTLLSAPAALALAAGWNVTGIATWDLITAAFWVPAFLGHPF